MLSQKSLSLIKAKLDQDADLKKRFDALVQKATQGKTLTEAEFQKILENNPALKEEFKNLFSDLTDGVELSAEELEQINAGFLQFVLPVIMVVGEAIGRFIWKKPRP